MSWMPNCSQSALVSICCGPLLMSENCTCARHVARSGHHRLTTFGGHRALPLRCTETMQRQGGMAKRRHSTDSIRGNRRCTGMGKQGFLGE